MREPVSSSQWTLVLQRFRQHRLAVGSLAVFLLLILVAFIGGPLWTYGYADITPDNSAAPSLAHPFGTDGLGRDTFAQVLRGTQKSVQIALIVALLSTAIGTVVGAVAGYYGGWIDTALMRLVDLVLTVPALVVLAVLAANFGSDPLGWLYISLILAGLLWAQVSRVVRGVVLSLAQKEFVEAARGLGASDARIIVRHLLPNALGPIIVNATVYVAVAILLESGLSFLGLGVQPPDTSLGLLVSQNVSASQTRPWLFYFPGLFIIVIALAVNFIGDGLRDAFEPTQRRGRS